MPLGVAEVLQQGVETGLAGTLPRPVSADLETLAYRVVHLQAEGTPADTEASIARIAVTQTDQLVAEALFAALNSASVRDKRSGAALHGAIEDHWRYAQAATVASGTIEIQRMIVGRAALGRA